MENQVKSKRGGSKFIHDGFAYVFDKASKADNTLKFYRCEQKDRCKARIHVQNNAVIKFLNDHSHEPTPAKIEVDAAKTKIKQLSESSREPTVQVINQCIDNLSQAAQASMPDQCALRKIVRRKRHEVLAPPPAPTSAVDLVLPERYTTIDAHGENEQFLLADNGPREDRILIFGRRSNLRYLQQAENVYVDGTFKSAPPLFAQVYIILASVYGGVIPILYGLLPNKRRQTYGEFFRMVKDVAPDFKPMRIFCDFEIAAILAIQEQLAESAISGCFFHLSQNLQRHMAQLGLRSQYNNEADFAVHVKMILSLAFVPIDRIDDALDHLYATLPLEIQKLLNYFEDNYVGRPNRRGGGRRQPLFPPEIWNLYQRVRDGVDRTNNHAEAANRRIQNELGMDHPTIWKFIDALKKIQAGRDVFLERLIAGNEPPSKLKKYIQADQRIESLVLDYENRNLNDFLRGIAYKFEMRQN
ncbi:uncharacterized protein LOC126891239 [Diabrotica virgifera virgifera]|uniref:MULE transposase domain-containing protein n=1 Tax=Diabrotica virgifera virgifera TaxID=50390 RepID=A0ABM5L1R1_DIAVI|nr:uncharacterized protein LOC126891239 [Diabrotica virgifera virgifera]